MAIHDVAPVVAETRPRWSRVAGMSAACIVHGVMFGLLLLAPRSELPAQTDDGDLPLVVIQHEPEPVVPPPPPVPELPPPPVIEQRPVTPPPVAVPPVLIPTAPESPVAIQVDPQPPAPPTPRSEPVADGGPSLGADYESRKGLVYPQQSVIKREQGTVLLRVLVNVDGSPDQVDVQRSSGSRHLDRAAVDAVKRWRFRPGTRNGVATAGWVVVPIDFRLNQ